MADNYFQPVHNHFDLNPADLEDVDDDIFLNTRSSSSSSGLGSNYGGGAVGGVRSTNPFEEDMHQMYAQRRRELEERALESTQRSLGLLYETEDIGKATAVELAKQREQLENTSRQLDEIHSTLRFSQRHLNSLKSVFGGLKNYLAGNRDVPSPMQPSAANTQNRGGGGVTTLTTQQPPQYTTASSSISPKIAHSPSERYDSHPISRIRDDSTAFQQREQAQAQRSKNPFDMQLEANLDEMCDNLSRLKGLATDLGGEIESQNEMLDNMNYNIEDVDQKMGKQNKEMYKLLGRK